MLTRFAASLTVVSCGLRPSAVLCGESPVRSRLSRFCSRRRASHPSFGFFSPIDQLPARSSASLFLKGQRKQAAVALRQRQRWGRLTLALSQRTEKQA
jgi:hypothetical protein